MTGETFEDWERGISSETVLCCAELHELLPSILPQLGADNMDQLRKLAQNFPGAGRHGPRRPPRRRGHHRGRGRGRRCAPQPHCALVPPALHIRHLSTSFTSLYRVRCSLCGRSGCTGTSAICILIQLTAEGPLEVVHLSRSGLGVQLAPCSLLACREVLAPDVCTARTLYS